MDYTGKRSEKERLASLQSSLLPPYSEIIDAIEERLTDLHAQAGRGRAVEDDRRAGIRRGGGSLR